VLAKFEPDSPIDDGESTSGSPRKNPFGLDLLSRTDWFVVRMSKVVEGVGSYLVISVGQKSFNCRIMMGFVPQSSLHFESLIKLIS
jgi:P-type Ca2+ transporter type 2C